ncbi:proton-conducting transporter transmembrane domain-containing protein, partial [Acinetobacter rudis]
MNFTLSFNELMPLAPVMIVALTAIVVMILTAIKRNHNLVATTAVVGLNLALASILLTLFGATIKPATVMNLFMVDPFTLIYQVMILIAALACCTLSHAYIDSYKSNREELYLLMLISVAGAMLMVASTHFASFFISLELMSIPVYGLLAYTHQRSKSLEAGLKYLVLSATASAMLLMGMAFVYATLGSLSFAGQIDDMFWALTKAESPETIMALQGYMAKYDHLL